MEFTLVKEIKNVINNLKEGYFSNNFIYVLGDTINKLSSKDYDRLIILDKGTIDEMIRAEVNRLINRSFNNDRFKR